MKKFSVIFLLISAFYSSSVFAASRVVEEMNYFASLRSAETNVRAGPGQNYPVKFTFKLRNIPVKVISLYDNWNEIEDYDGQTGWVTQTLLTKKRTVIVRTTKEFVNMYSKNSEKSRTIFRLENNVILDYIKCEEGWCAVKINNKKGWVESGNLFGV